MPRRGPGRRDTRHVSQQVCEQMPKIMPRPAGGASLPPGRAGQTVCREVPAPLEGDRAQDGLFVPLGSWGRGRLLWNEAQNGGVLSVR